MDGDFVHFHGSILSHLLYHRQKISLAQQGQALGFVAQDNELIAGLDVENLACLRRYYDLPFIADRDQPKGVPALGRYVQPGSGGVIVDEIVQRDAENFRQLLAALNVGQTFPSFP